MPLFGKVLFRLCIAIGVLVGGGMMFHSDPQVQTWGVYILVGMVIVGLVLRWIFQLVGMVIVGLVLRWIFQIFR